MNNSNIKFFTFLFLVGLTFNSCQEDDPVIIVEENIPTITKEWFFETGQERIEYEAENPEVLTQPTVGKNKTWDFSEVTESSMGSYTISFVEPAGLPSANLFPDATVAQLHPNSFVIYYEASNDTLKIVGAHISNSYHITFNQSPLRGIDPLKFGESFDFFWSKHR